MNKTAIILFTGIFFMIFGSIFLVYKLTKTAEVSKTSNVKFSTNKASHDWGTISMANGKVETTFDIQNDGTEPLKLYNVTTSCTCTTAKILYKDTKSPTYTMHSKSNHVSEVAPGETAQIQMVFDPAFHGPSGVGSMTRSITVMTNSNQQPSITFTATAQVEK